MKDEQDGNWARWLGYAEIDAEKRAVMAEVESPRHEPRQVTVEVLMGDQVTKPGDIGPRDLGR
jgi:hypothetical protein